MTKQNLIDLDDSLILSNPALITKSDHSEVNNALINEIFPETITVTHANGQGIVQLVSGMPILFEIQITKQGSVVTMNGWFANNSNNILGSSYFVEFLNDDYKPSDAVTALAFTDGLNGWIAEIITKVDNLGIYNATAMPGQSKFNFNLKYNV